MSSATGHDRIDSLASLARLSLERDERDVLAGQLDTIAAYLEILQSVDVDGVPEYSAPLPAAVRLRDDVADAPIDREVILAGAPVSRDGLVVVPRFLEG